MRRPVTIGAISQRDCSEVCRTHKIHSSSKIQEVSIPIEDNYRVRFRLYGEFIFKTSGVRVITNNPPRVSGNDTGDHL